MKKNLKTLVSYLLIISVLITSCTVNKVYKNIDKDFNKLNKKIKRKKVELSLENGNIIKTDDIVILPDSVFSTQSNSFVERICPTNELQYIKIRTRGRSAVAGLGIGIILGAICGKVMSRGELDSPLTILFSMMISGVFGAVGLLTGALKGAEDKYILSQNIIEFTYSDLDLKIILPYGRILKGKIISIDNEYYYLKKGEKLTVINKSMIYKITYQNLELTEKFRSKSYQKSIDESMYNKIEIINR